MIIGFWQDATFVSPVKNLFFISENGGNANR